eukprot:c15785_g1_i4.p1 GENE.c15785_g1_i4~~c15785_g1_i4.p1  ORF type:complete len:812 (+),score=182.22 c15785_g1_i4:23-2437(+)
MLTTPLLQGDDDEEIGLEESSHTVVHRRKHWTFLMVAVSAIGIAAVALGLFVVVDHRMDPSSSSLSSRLIRSLSHRLRPSNPNPPNDWIDAINAFDMVWTSEDDSVLSPDLLPPIGNGFIAGNPNSGTLYVGGVFTGAALNENHRAAIPNQIHISIGDLCTIPCLAIDASALNFRTGTFYRRGRVVASEGTVLFEQRWFAHRKLRSIMVANIDVAYPYGKPGNVTITLTSRPEISVDVTTKIISDTPESITHLHTTTEAETPSSSLFRVATVCSKVPNSGTFLVTKNQTLTFICAVRTSVEDPSRTSDELVQDATRDFQNAIQMTPSELSESHADAWAEIWKSGVEISGRPDVSIAINASLFSILSSVRDDHPWGLSPGGLTNGYHGHSFWDTEIWMFPSLLVLHPEIARSLLSYRVDTLPGAHIKAKSYVGRNWTGAMIAWESATTGVEATPPQFDSGAWEHHISGDVSFAAWQFFLATQDISWLRDLGSQILFQVADYWTSRPITSRHTQALSPDDNLTETLHIDQVVPPDEYHRGNDSVFTNVGADMALEFAIQASKILDQPANRDRWQKVQGRLAMLYDSKQDIHPEFAEYTGDEIKQADVVLLGYPLGFGMAKSTRINDLSYYAQRTDENGPAMTWGMHSINHLELGDMDQANVFFNKSFTGHLSQSPFAVWMETLQGGCPNFLTGAGGFLQTVVFGWPGIRLHFGGLHLLVRNLPDNAKSMRIRNVTFGRALFVIDFTNDTTQITLTTPSDAAPFSLKRRNLDTVVLSPNVPFVYPSSQEALLCSSNSVLACDWTAKI